MNEDDKPQPQTETAKPAEIDEAKLDQVSGGAKRPKANEYEGQH